MSLTGAAMTSVALGSGFPLKKCDYFFRGGSASRDVDRRVEKS